MTFKHTKFEESVTMRSLERLAKEKGLIKNNVLEKIASNPKKTKVDLIPTDNLTENLLKLCNGLRASGMEKYAKELESTFMIYKQASTMCDEDLIDQAHPDGSPSLEGVQGDAVIETILDQQLAMIQMVNKNPTGKLTNAKSIINAVKMSLGKGDKIIELQQQISSQLQRVKGIMKGFCQRANEDLSSDIGGVLPEFISSIQANPTREALIDLNQRIDDVAERARPEWTGMGVKESTWEVIQGMPGDAKQSVNRAIQFMNNILQIRQQEIMSPFQEEKLEEFKDELDPGKEYGIRHEEEIPEFTPLRKTINTLIPKLNNYKPVIKLMENKQDVVNGTKFINDSIKKLEDINYAMTQIDPDQAGQFISNLTGRVEKVNKEVTDFYNGWIA